MDLDERIKLLTKRITDLEEQVVDYQTRYKTLCNMIKSNANDILNDDNLGIK